VPETVREKHGINTKKKQKNSKVQATGGDRRIERTHNINATHQGVQQKWRIHDMLSGAAWNP
jgi:hypothetical protein